LHACVALILLGVLSWEAGLGILGSTLSFWLSISEQLSAWLLILSYMYYTVHTYLTSREEEVVSASKHATDGVATTISLSLVEQSWVQLNAPNSLKQRCRIGYYGSAV